MKQLNNVVIILLISLMCSVLPANSISIFSMIFIILNMSALGGYTEKLSYDAAGNRIRRETEQEITTYRYDNCNRLQELRREYKNAETSTAQPQIIHYTYDRQGHINLLQRKERIGLIDKSVILVLI